MCKHLWKWNAAIKKRQAAIWGNLAVSASSCPVSVSLQMSKSQVPGPNSNFFEAVFLLVYQYSPRFVVPWKPTTNSCRVEEAVGGLISSQMTSNFKGTDQIYKFKRKYRIYPYVQNNHSTHTTCVHRRAARQSFDELPPACASICGGGRSSSRRGRQSRQEELALPGLQPQVPVPHQAKVNCTTLTKPRNEHLLVRRCCPVP